MSELDDACERLKTEANKLTGRLQRQNEIDDLRKQLAAVTAENAKLRERVRAADRMRGCLDARCLACMPPIDNIAVNAYDAARKGVKG